MFLLFGLPLQKSQANNGHTVSVLLDARFEFSGVNFRNVILLGVIMLYLNITVTGFPYIYI